MSTSEIIMLWSDNRGLSLLIWTIVLVTAMYLARSSAHQSIAAVARSIRAALRMSAASLMALEQRMVKRNKQVILQAGQESTERVIEREFQRVNMIVERDLSGPISSTRSRRTIRRPMKHRRHRPSGWKRSTPYRVSRRVATRLSARCCRVFRKPLSLRMRKPSSPTAKAAWIACRC